MEIDATKPAGPFCQSCGMPLSKWTDYGTNADESANTEYCFYCYQNGEFTEPGITMEQMTDKVVGFMVQMRQMSERQARKLMERFVPTLKRWA